MQDYFLSFWSGDKDWAHTLHENLEAHGLVGFFSEEDIRGGKSWIDEVERALDATRRLVLVWSPEAAVRPRVRDEWQAIIGKRPQWAAEGRIVAAMHARAPLPTYFRRAQSINFTEPKQYATSFDALLTALEFIGARLSTSKLRQPPIGHPRLSLELRDAFEELLAPLTATNAVCTGFEAELGLDKNTVKAMPKDERASAVLALACMPPRSTLDGARDVIKLLRDNIDADDGRLRGSLKQLEARLARWKPPAAEDPLQPYLRRLKDAHSELLPFFRTRVQHAGLGQVCVQLELVPEHSTLESTRNLSLLDLLKHEPRRWVVRGDPGAGKTTLLRHVVFEKADHFDLHAVPVYLSVRDLFAQRGDGWGRVRAHLESHGEAAVLDALESARTEGRLVVLLDGLDEIEDTKRSAATNLVSQLSDALGSSTLVVASRRIGYAKAPLPAPFVVADVQKLEHAQQVRLLTHYLRPEAAQRRTPSDWVDTLNGNASLAEDAANPLLLTLMAIVINGGGAPGPRRSQLYDQVLAKLLADEHHEPSRPLPLVDYVRDALVDIAAEMTHRGEIECPLSVMETALLKANKRCDGVLLEPSAWGAAPGDSITQAVLSRLRSCGILGPYRGSERDWSFWHRSFQEALTAKSLLQSGVDAAVERAASVDDRLNLWAEAFAFLAGDVEHPDELIAKLAKTNRSVALRAVASAEKLRAETIEAVLGLTEDIEERGWLLVLLADKLGSLDSAVRLLDQIRRTAATPEDLYFIDRALLAIANSEPSLSGDVALRRAALFDHLAKPSGPLFETVQTCQGEHPCWAPIPGGQFRMGSASGGYRDERPVHRVQFEHAFDLFRTPVTRAQYARFDRRATVTPGREREPMNEVSWYAATMFCRWLGARLPSEAEWEYACRAGTTTEYWSGNDEGDLARVGWYVKNSGNRVHPVGEKPANPWGLFDMHGNVWEWCEDTSHSDYNGAPSDGNSWVDEVSSGRGFRGGSFQVTAEFVRSAYRGRSNRSARWSSVGFRPARSVITD